MFLVLLLFLIPSVPVHAMELLRDRHGNEEYVFEQPDLACEIVGLAANLSCGQRPGTITARFGHIKIGANWM
jgi:hypothetical protein